MGHTLLHVPLTVPHDRLQVTGKKSLETTRGEAFVASVEWDGVPFGTFDNEGTGGPTLFHATDVDGRYRERTEAWEEYVRACVYSDERVAGRASRTRKKSAAMSEEYVADQLVQNYEVAEFVAPQAAGEYVCVRVFSLTTGFYTELLGFNMLRRPYEPAMDEAFRSSMRRAGQTNPQPGDVLQVWTGQKWKDLTVPLEDDTATS